MSAVLKHRSGGVGARSQHPSGVLATGGSVVGQPRFTCLNCGSEWEHHELLRIRESHGEVLLYCPGCQSGELE